MKIRFWVLINIFLILSVQSALAAPVTLQISGQWVDSPYNYYGPFTIGTSFTIMLTYDANLAVPNGGAGSYAVLSQSILTTTQASQLRSDTFYGQSATENLNNFSISGGQNLGWVNKGLGISLQSSSNLLSNTVLTGGAELAQIDMSKWDIDRSVRYGEYYPDAYYQQDGVINSISLAAPIPSAAWLFGSSLIGLMGYIKRRVSS